MSEDIFVEKFDEVFLKVHCDDSILMELYEYFSFTVPGARFMPAFKARIWDGRKRLFNVQNKSLYVGLLEHLKIFAKKSNYSIKIDEKLEKNDKITKEIVENFLPLITPCSQGKPLEIRDYQIEAIYTALRNERALLVSPTGCLDGNTVIQALIE